MNGIFHWPGKAYSLRFPSFLSLFSGMILSNHRSSNKCNIVQYFLGARVAQWLRSLDLTAHTSLSPIRRGVLAQLCKLNYKKGCTRLAVASDKVYQLLAQGRWFSRGTPASSTTKTGRHDITEILLKVALKHQKSIKIKNHIFFLNINDLLK